MIRVVVADDFPIMREALVAVLEADPGIEVVGHAETGRGVLERLRTLEPDVAVMDLRMPEGDGLSVLEQLREDGLGVRVIILTATERPESMLAAVAAGAAGYLSKRSSPEEIRSAVTTVHGGGAVVSPALASHLLADYAAGSQGGASPRSTLTEGEQEVLELVARGLTDTEIARDLQMSPRTVQTRLGAIRSKTGLQRRAELVRWAAEHLLT
jgi:DNA-binding NarL/FixJ family response regulator